jgi:hypothetical protein
VWGCCQGPPFPKRIPSTQVCWCTQQLSLLWCVCLGGAAQHGWIAGRQRRRQAGGCCPGCIVWCQVLLGDRCPPGLIQRRKRARSVVWRRHVPHVNMVPLVVSIFEVNTWLQGSAGGRPGASSWCAAQEVLLLAAAWRRRAACPAAPTQHPSQGRPWAQCRSTTVDPVIVGCNNTMILTSLSASL